MTARARVMLFVQAPEGKRSTIEELYRQVSGVLDGTPGLLRNELLHSCSKPTDFVVLSEWESLESFRAWEQGPVHRGNMLESLRQYTTGAAFYEVLAAF
ncbi:antibiotic biosynthesis monooxygenase family protein [Archangium lipolyticum]|uniref:antibiotic biosynthesis monooxygenase family protein n=1 Tax=Archangium lipolyticum TaxID=2970465 RepID=UPI002149B06E|nr:antibiotic biosynthesis monooxygenase [Archangium lipolyticum]